MRARSIALRVLLTSAASLVLAGLWARSTREEGETLGTLLGVTGSLNVNDRPAAVVNRSRDPLDPQERDDAPLPMDGRELVRRRHQKLRAMLTDGAPIEVLMQTVDSMFDYGDLARHALGKPCPAKTPSCTNHWDALTDDQQKEITDLLRKLVAHNLQSTRDGLLAYEIAYPSIRDLGNGLSKVRTEAKRSVEPQTTAVSVDYVVKRSGNHYRVVDVITEGSSFTSNYYDQFHRMLTRLDQGYPYIVKKIEAKVSSPRR